MGEHVLANLETVCERVKGSQGYEPCVTLSPLVMSASWRIFTGVVRVAVLRCKRSANPRLRGAARTEAAKIALLRRMESFMIRMIDRKSEGRTGWREGLET